MNKLPREFYDRDTALVARELLGKWIVHRVAGMDLIARIVETEAYIGAQDKASHSSKGLTERTRVMFGPPGFAYVYLIYGRHHCVNVVTERAGIGAAVLIRAVEPVNDITDRTNGPGLLTRAMRITRDRNGCDLLSDGLFLTDPIQIETIHIIKTRRIGVDYAGAWAKRHLRFYIRGNKYVSRI